ncbi:zinc finger, CCHC-type containing protein [Tanacetum coccineum]
MIKRFRTDSGGEYMDTLYFQPVALSEGLWGEAMLTTCYLLNKVLNKRNKTTTYELWTKRKPNLNYLEVWGCKAVVTCKTPCSKAENFRDAIFDENRFSLIPRPNHMVSGSIETKYDGSYVLEEVFEEVVVQQPKLRKRKRVRIPKSFRPELQLYLIEGTMDDVFDQHSYCFNIEDNPKTFDEAMKFQDIAFWKEAINDEMDSIMGSNTWVLADLPPSCKPLGCKLFFKRKLKVDGTIEKLKARLAIQGFKQKSGIHYFDTYALVAHISTIRLLIALALIHNLIIHQMDVKTAFLYGELDEELYTNQPHGSSCLAMKPSV